MGQASQLATAVVTAGVVPVVLGPAMFGNYNFLLSTAAAIRGFTEPSAQEAFFTFASQERASGPLVKLYGGWLLVQLALLVCLVLSSFALGMTHWIWPGQRTDQILLITVLDWVLFVFVSLKQLGDSKGLAVRPQAIGVGTSILALAALLVLAVTHYLDFYTYAVLNLAVGTLGCVALGYWLLTSQYDLCWAGEMRPRFGAYIRRWWRYAAPLILVDYYTPLVAFLSIYLVQVWYGSVEQGYLALASRWSAVVLVFTASALAIVWREIALTISLGDRGRASLIFLKSSTLLFFVTLVLCLWLAAGSHLLVGAWAGSAYAPGASVLAIMAFNPAVQTLGQLNSVAFKATGRTAAYRNLAILLSIPDLVITYVLLAPRSAAIPGFELGASGVALRMVVYGLVSVLVSERFNLKYFELSWYAASWQKLLATTVIGACGVVSFVVLSGMLARLRLGGLPGFAMSSVVYLSSIAGLVVLRPGLLGLHRSDLVAAAAHVRASASGLFGPGDNVEHPEQ